MQHSEEDTSNNNLMDNIPGSHDKIENGKISSNGKMNNQKNTIDQPKQSQDQSNQDLSQHPFCETDEFMEEINREIPTADDQEESQTLTHQVRHEVAIPPGYPYVPLNHSAPDLTKVVPARSWKFKLDPFQQVSVNCLERHESVLVSAHTSAGKTVVAEYAIAMSLRDKQRVIYTSPIKALSNQKYRELQQEFTDVGLMTGDISINPTASCLVMTTEILRSMLYRGSEVMREVAWIIFDEVHYMRDKVRGVVWEETLILVPDSVKFVFLSATIPNAKQFAQWICNLHEQPCHVVYTDYRPTPLQHYLFPSGGSGIYLAVDEKGTFREDNFQRALAALVDFDRNEAALGKYDEERSGSGKRFKPQKDSRSSSADLYKIINLIQQKNNLPVIVFSFSRKDCESHALRSAKVDFSSEEEKNAIETVFTNAMESLGEEDRKLPQIASILPLLKRGIGIHHSGLLPILKEVIEILFQEGLLKVLFATETFSIGLNMPAKTVVFTNVRKFDGKVFRWISGGEYIQMSGRAGRRGLDDRGIVILMLDEKMEPPVAKGMLKGQADPLNSAFHLSYNMILNLMRVEGIAPEKMLEKSFFQFQNNECLPELERQLNRLQKERSTFPPIEQENEIEGYYGLKQELASIQHNIKKVLYHPSYILPFVQPGRLVYVREGEKDFGWGCFIGLQRKSRLNQQGKLVSNNEFVIDVLIRTKLGSTSAHCEPALSNEGSNSGEKEASEMIIVPMTLSAIDGVSTVRVNLPKDLSTKESKNHVGKSIREIIKRFEAKPLLPNSIQYIPLLDPIADLGITDDSFKKMQRKIDLIQESLSTNPLTESPERLERLYSLFEERFQLDEKIRLLEKQIQNTTAIIHMDELKCRKRVLRRLGFLTNDDVIEMKGRVACEISSGDELLLTEMIFNGIFNDLSVENSVALLSCFVFEEKASNEADIWTGVPEELKRLYKVVQEMAVRISKVSSESKLQLDNDSYVDSFRPELMNVVYHWSKGAKFIEICKMTSVFEGSIIRCLKRLEELLRQMCMAAKSIGNVELENKFADGITKIKRDIVFANSLYL